MAKTLHEFSATPAYKALLRHSVDETRPSRESFLESQQDIHEQQARTSRNAILLRAVYAASIFTSVAALIAVILGGLILLFINAKSSDKTWSTNSCGKTETEAIALNCTFDQLTWSWYPPNCPHYANNEFLEAGNWTYYMDGLGNEVATGVNWTKAMNNEVELYTEEREHATHCIYMFLSVAQLVRDKTPSTQKIRDYGHMKHCADMILEILRKDDDWYKITTGVPPVNYQQSC